MKTIKTIVEAGMSESGYCLVYYTVPGMLPGTRHAYAFPLMQLGYRAAEYGLDPADVDGLFTFVLHELADPRMQLSDRHPHFLYNTTEETAREEALKRLAVVEVDTVHHDPEGHLEKLKEAYLSQWSPVFHRGHQNTVRELRTRRLEALKAGRQE